MRTVSRGGLCISVAKASLFHTMSERSEYNQVVMFQNQAITITSVIFQTNKYGAGRRAGQGFF